VFTVTGRDQTALLTIAAQPGNRGKGVDTTEGVVNVGNAIESDRQVVGESERGEGGSGGKVVDKGVVGDEKQKGGEGAPLLHSPPDIDADIGLGAEEGRDFDILNRSLEEVPEPEGETGFDKEVSDPIVIDGIKGFSRVKKENKPVPPLDNRFVKEGVQLDYVVSTLHARQKTLLRWVDEVLNSFHDGS